MLGRTVKTEVLNWQGGTVYSATINTYNARDQITQILQYAGPEGSSSVQTTTMTYDGFGRLKTKHVPEQDAGKVTTWDYYSDDTVEKVTDARGVTTTFNYNGRHLVTSIGYPNASSLPAGVLPASNVGLGYDAAGNRISMTDGMGSMNYVYDQLSRLKSETRTFNDPGNPTVNGVARVLTYGYNPGGSMTSITDPFGAQVNYNFDGAGRVASVTGSGFAGVSTYASNIEYRAWGEQKSATYGDNKSGTTSYDARMRPSAYEFPGLSEQFQYYDDGRLKQMTDLDDRAQDIGFPDTARHFSRVQTYDHAGRLTTAKGTPQSSLPYVQNYARDAFNNLTSRFGTYYYQSQTSDSATFLNNRRQDPNWSYYADGQVKHSPLEYDANFNESVYRDWSYDAAGRMVQVQETLTNPSSVSTYKTSYDGDGQPVSESTTKTSSNTTGYMIRSSVLGGRVLTRLDSSGNKLTTVVNVDGRLMAVQSSVGGTNSVSWTHVDPLGLSEAGDIKSVYDPLGNYIPWQAAPSAPPNAYPPFSPNFGGQGSSFGASRDKSCVLNGLPVLCTDLAHQIEIGNVSAQEILHGGRRSIETPVFSFGVGMSYYGGLDLPGDSGGYKGTVTEGGIEYDVIDGNTNSTRGHYALFLRSVAPQEPAKPSHDKGTAMDIARRKNCATPNSIVEQFKNDFEAQWKRTTQSGEENGSLLFYDKGTNAYPRVALSEGRPDTDGVPALPLARPETDKAFDDFRRSGRSIYFLAFFHTHPNYRSGDSRSGGPSGGDVQYQSDYRNVLGILRTGKGYSFFSNGSTFWPDNPRADECAWILKNQ